MKYLATTLLMFIFFGALAQKEFAPIGATWYYTKMETTFFPDFGYMKHECIKDSIIEGQPVKVIEKTLFLSDSTIEPQGYEYILQKGDTIFYWKSGEFHILYNFSLQKGDSLLLYSEMPNQCEEKTNYGWSIVDSIFHKTINKIELKGYNTLGIHGSIWGFDYLPTLEIIGNLGYLFPQNLFCGFYDGFPQIGNLRCYNDDSLGFFQFTKEICDSTFNYRVNVETITKGNQFSVNSNPTNDMITIDYNGNGDITGYNFMLYNVIGNKKIEKGIAGHKTNKDISYLNKGIYILLIQSGKKIIDYEKILKK